MQKSVKIGYENEEMMIKKQLVTMGKGNEYYYFFTFLQLNATSGLLTWLGGKTFLGKNVMA
jgi:hypothetical protein